MDSMISLQVERTNFYFTIVIIIFRFVFFCTMLYFYLLLYNKSLLFHTHEFLYYFLYFQFLYVSFLSVVRIDSKVYYCDDLKGVARGAIWIDHLGNRN